MKLVGLTGNIGSGKSTAASFFRELDYVVIGADLLAREVLQKKEVIEEVVASFGEQVLIQGKIQPTLLAKIVFHNKENVEKMNAISHPRIQEMSLTKIKELYQKNEKVKIIYDAPLLIEAGVYSKMQAVILMITSFENIFKRLNQRALSKGTRISEGSVRQSMQYQIKPKEARKFARFIIDGNTSLEVIKKQGLDCKKRIFISDLAHLILPIHKIKDRLSEQKKNTPTIGTTGKGIGPAYTDKVSRKGIRICDLSEGADFKKIFFQKMKQDFAEISATYKNIKLLPIKNHYTELMDAYQKIKENICDAHELIIDKKNKNILLEGAQGSLLDIDYGTYPYVTSSNTIAGMSTIGSGVGPRHIDAIFGILKILKSQ